MDPEFSNNVILTQTEFLTMNSRPKQPKYARNKNILVIGGSGSGKTRFFVKPNLMQMHSSYVVTDPKGTVLVECGMQEIFDETTDCVIGLMKDVHETFRVRKQEAAEDDADTVTIAKEDYETMIDDLLTMSEIIQMVTDLRTKDASFIQKFAEFMPAYAEFEKDRLALYRDAAKEAEDIFDRWADEFDDLDEDFMEDEDYEPDEYYSD